MWVKDLDIGLWMSDAGCIFEAGCEYVKEVFEMKRIFFFTKLECNFILAILFTGRICHMTLSQYEKCLEIKQNNQKHAETTQ